MGRHPISQPHSAAEAAARERLDARYRAPLMKFFLRRVGHRSDAEDLTQEVFVRLVGMATGPDPRGADAYVFTIASNLLRDRARRRKTRLTASHDSMDDPGVGERVASTLIEDRGPDRVLLGQEELEEAFSALAELGQRTRDIFVLYRLENMKQRDIAALFGVSVSAIEKHVVKALAHLAQRFER